jgi:hypothetical protein
MRPDVSLLKKCEINMRQNCEHYVVFLFLSHNLKSNKATSSFQIGMARDTNPLGLASSDPYL